MRSPSLRSAALLVLLGLLVAPAAIQLGYLISFGVNVPYWDQWDFVPLIRKAFEGKLTFGELWEPYAEQRLLFPRLAMLGLAAITHYNVMAEMYLSWVLLVASCGLLYVLYRRFAPNGPLGLLMFLPITWLLFSVRQWESLLWGWQVQRYIALFFFIGTVYLLDQTRRPGLRFGLAIACATASSFSLASGLLSWPIGLAQIVLTGRAEDRRWARESRRLALIYALCGAAVVILYLKDYHPPENHPGLSDVIRQPLNAFRYLLVALANPLSVEKENAIALGSFVGGCYLVALALAARSIRAARLESPVPLALLLFGLFDVGLLVIGRSGFGVGQALESRYAAEISLGIIGLYLVLASDRILQPPVRSLLVGLLAGVMIVGLGTGFQRGMAEGYVLYLQRTEDQYLVRTSAQQDLEALRRIGPEPELVKRQARWLAQSYLGPFREAVASANRQ